jgi:hypothetical protein
VGALLVWSGAVWFAEIVIVPSFCCHYYSPVSAHDMFRIQHLEESWRSCQIPALSQDELQV